MILAAGRGQRLRPFTDRVPKPLVEVAGQPLIAHHLRKLAAAGFDEVVVNTAYKGRALREALGDGRRYGLRVHCTEETPGALDTGGGIAAALDHLGEAPFAVISADVFSDLDYRALYTAPGPDSDAYLMLVDNPRHHPEGDFGLCAGRLVEHAPRLTYAGLGVFAPAPFARRRGQCFALSCIIRQALDASRATGRHHAGHWCDVGRARTLAGVRQAQDKPCRRAADDLSS